MPPISPLEPEDQDAVRDGKLSKADLVAETQARVSRYIDSTARGKNSVSWDDVTVWAVNPAFQIRRRPRSATRRRPEGRPPTAASAGV